MSAFEECGIYLFNSNKITSDKLATSEPRANAVTASGGKTGVNEVMASAVSYCQLLNLNHYQLLL